LGGPFILVYFIALGIKIKNWKESMHAFKLFY
jgi:hypothetical protein